MFVVLNESIIPGHLPIMALPNPMENSNGHSKDQFSCPDGPFMRIVRRHVRVIRGTHIKLDELVELTYNLHRKNEKKKIYRIARCLVLWCLVSVLVWLMTTIRGSTHAIFRTVIYEFDNLYFDSNSHSMIVDTAWNWAFDE
jgi:hypothetical protein